MEVVEVYYKVGEVADAKTLARALAFRNAAMEHIEAVLMAAELGEWSDSELLTPYVTFAFTVTDAARAETVIRAAVDGTPFGSIDHIIRREVDE